MQLTMQFSVRQSLSFESYFVFYAKVPLILSVGSFSFSASQKVFGKLFECEYNIVILCMRKLISWGLIELKIAINGKICLIVEFHLRFSDSSK